MADRVIVVGTERARKMIPVSDVKQMVGRGGRKHDGGSCRATIVVESQNYETVKEGMESDEGFHVQSSLASADSLAFHLLPEVCTGRVANGDSAKGWYDRSFGAWGGIEPEFDKAIELLVEVNAAEWQGSILRPTKLGEIASRLYFHPADVWAWKNNFETIIDYGLETNDTAVAWAFGSVPVTRMAGDFGDHWQAVEECRSSLPPNLIISKGTLVTITLWKYVLGGCAVGKMRNQALALLDDSKRICRALGDLDKLVTNRGYGAYYEELAWRCRKRIPSELVFLCKIEGMTKSAAFHFYDIGVRSIEDLPEALHNLEGEIDERLFEVLKKAI